MLGLIDKISFIENINLFKLFSDPTNLIFFLIISLTFLLIVPLLLWLSTKILKIKNNYKKAFITVFIIYLLGIIVSSITALINEQAAIITTWVLVTILFAFWLIKRRYELDLKKGLMVWLLWTVFSKIFTYSLIYIAYFAGMIIGYITLIF